MTPVFVSKRVCHLLGSGSPVPDNVGACAFSTVWSANTSASPLCDSLIPSATGAMLSCLLPDSPQNYSFLLSPYSVSCISSIPDHVLIM